MQWSTSAGATPARSKAATAACTPRSVAERSLSLPPKAPKPVRTPERKTMSGWVTGTPGWAMGTGKYGRARVGVPSARCPGGAQGPVPTSRVPVDAEEEAECVVGAGCRAADRDDGLGAEVAVARPRSRRADHQTRARAGGHGPPRDPDAGGAEGRVHSLCGAGKAPLTDADGHAGGERDPGLGTAEGGETELPEVEIEGLVQAGDRLPRVSEASAQPVAVADGQAEFDDSGAALAAVRCPGRVAGVPARRHLDPDRDPRGGVALLAGDGGRAVHFEAETDAGPGAEAEDRDQVLAVLGGIVLEAGAALRAGHACREAAHRPRAG